MDIPADPMVCATCRVITVSVAGVWTHPAQLRERFSNVVCDEPEPGRAPKERELRYGRGDTARSDKYSVQGALESAAVPAGEPVALATNGSYKVSQAARGVFDGVSWGYLCTNGAYGLGTAVMPARMIGSKPGVHAELRAIWRGLRRVLPEHPVLLVSNSTRALGLVSQWKAGERRRSGERPMPWGYDTRLRASGRKATLVALAELCERNAARLDTMWVEALGGMSLNEGAHSLARIAQAWASGRLRKEDVLSDAAGVARRILPLQTGPPMGGQQSHPDG
jgi:hypothetical protein